MKALGSYLVEQGDVQREAEAVPQADLVCQSVAELAGGGGRVRQEGFRGAVHEGDRQHDGLLGLGGLKSGPDQILVGLGDVTSDQRHD